MSRHRYVRNLAEEDYYDDYDDDDDYYDDQEEEEEQQDYRPPTSTTATIQAQTLTAQATFNSSKPSSTTITNKSLTVSAGVTKPPPGCDKPSSQQPQPQPQSVSTGGSINPKNTGAVTSTPHRNNSANPGITKPPPGWGKPPPTNASAYLSTKASTGPLGQTKSSASASVSTSAEGVTKPPPGWGKPTATATPNNKSDANVNKASSLSPPPRTPVNVDFTTKNNNGKQSTIKTNATSTKSSSSNNTAPPPKPLPKSVLDRLQSLQQLKSQLTMVVMGHVDAGKSTLVGQLLVQCGQVSTRVVQKYEQQATSIGKSSFGLAWILDETEQERSRGVTMDIATKSLSLEQHDIILLDAPGHADFVPRMITGASSATVGLLVIAATPNEFDAGWNRGQTKEHVILARGLGVTQLIVAVNKLDVVQWNESRYQDILQRVHPFLIQQGFAADRITYCPISGLSGVNIMKRPSKGTDESSSALLLYQWYTGPTLLEAMNQLLPVPRNLLLEKPFRMIVTDIYSDGSSSQKTVQIRGRVIQGVVQLHDACVLLPIGDETTIGKMETFVAASALSHTGSSTTTGGEFAMAGELIDVTLTGIESSMRVSVGMIVCHSHIPLRPRISKRCRAKVWILPDLPPVVGPILRGVQVLFHMHHLDIPATISKLHYIISKAAADDAGADHCANPVTNANQSSSATSSSHLQQQQPQAQRPRFLTGGVTAVVEITLNDRVCMENFVDCRPLGRFALRKSGETIGVGVIDCVL